jgi:nucleotide-binding universal stress UspA family protein
VTIVEIRDAEPQGRRTAAGRRLVRYLARRNVRAVSMIAACSEDSVADELIRLAEAEGADLIVAGAYGNSRLGEWCSAAQRATCSHHARRAACWRIDWGVCTPPFPMSQR